jgi:arylsulfatase
VAVAAIAAVEGAQRAADQAYWRDLPRLAWLEVAGSLRQRAPLAALAATAAFLVAVAAGKRWPSTRGRRGARLATAAALALLALGAGIGLHAASRPAAGTTNVVLITIDTLRPDHLGAYGYPRPTSPHLDALAAESRVFHHAYSHGPATVIAVPALLTGRHPRESCDGVGGVAPAVHTIAERLRDAGYRTGAVVSNSVLGPHYRGFSEGFEHYDARLDVPERARPTMERLAPNTATAALEWIDATRDRPVFLWVHFQDPHGPYDPPAEHARLFVTDRPSGAVLPVNDGVGGFGGIPRYQFLDGRRDAGGYIDRYDAEIHFADEHVGRLIDGLRQRRVLDDAIVVVSSDHGEALGENGYYFTHGEDLQPVLLRVPLIVFDTRTRARGRVGAIVQHMDVAPTVLRRVGVATGGLPGRDLLAPEIEDAIVLSELLGKNYRSSLISRGVQLLHEPARRDMRVVEGDVRLPPPAPRADADRDVARLRAASLRLGAPGRPLDTLPAQLTGPEREALAALGYVDP